ncbi:MAG: helix-hairpin-helix domain-containing protein [Gammaproteobacteria bacterium]
MAFDETERARLLALRGVGPTVVARLEQLGFGSFCALAGADVETILAGGAALSGSSCWKASPQARAAIAAAVALAERETRGECDDEA